VHQEEDTLNTSSSESARLKDIPVPVSVPQQRAEGTATFTLPDECLRAPAKWVAPKSGGVEIADDDPVDWDIDPSGFRCLKAINKGERGYTGPPLEEAAFEKIIDRFEKAVKADVLPEIEALRKQLATTAPDPSAIDAAYEWWVQRRKQLAMPLIRGLRPPPDPEDPDTTGVAFRPREKEGVRRMRSNNKKVHAATCTPPLGVRAATTEERGPCLPESRPLHPPRLSAAAAAPCRPSPPLAALTALTALTARAHAQTYNLMASLHDEFSRLRSLC
jgi:hypothetical protein